MRIITGKYKGRTLYGSKNQSIRPTTGKAKEYIFELLSDFVPDKIVLDLFSGAGSLGLEALSRNASKATFVDIANASLKVLKKNISALKVENGCTTIKKDALGFLKTNEQPFDLIFADPPYTWDRFDTLFPLLFTNENLTPDGIVVLECEKSQTVPWENDTYTILRQKFFDRTIITFFERR